MEMGRGEERLQDSWMVKVISLIIYVYRVPALFSHKLPKGNIKVVKVLSLFLRSSVSLVYMITSLSSLHTTSWKLPTSLMMGRVRCPC